MTPLSDTSPPNRKIRLVGACGTTVWGLTSLERMHRIGRRYGVVDTSAYGGEALAGRVLFVRGDMLVEDRLVAALLQRSGVVLMVGAEVAALCIDGAAAETAAAVLADRADAAMLSKEWTILSPDAPVLGFNDTLRKREPPYVLDLSAIPVAAARWRMFGASYKGATDFVTKWIWPWPAYQVTRLCAALHITPNSVTAVSFALVLLTTWLFADHQYGLGLLSAWCMTFLDTVDGKLARVTVTSSRWGNIFDHGIDMIHPPFWYWAWWVGLDKPTTPLLMGSLAVILGGYVAGRLVEGAFLALFKMEMHIWRRFDYAFRAFTARRNPNLALLTAAWALDDPDAGFVTVAVWTAVSLGIHLSRLAQAILIRRRGGTITSFLISGAPRAAA